MQFVLASMINVVGAAPFCTGSSKRSPEVAPEEVFNFFADFDDSCFKTKE